MCLFHKQNLSCQWQTALLRSQTLSVHDTFVSMPFKLHSHCKASRSHQETSSIASIASITLVAFVFCAEKPSPEPVEFPAELVPQKQLSDCPLLGIWYNSKWSHIPGACKRQPTATANCHCKCPMLESSRAPTFASEFVHLPPSNVESL